MKRNKKSHSEGPCWHPDFRDPAALPDVKVIRTSFFLNVCAAVILCALLIFFFYREFESRSLEEQVESHNLRISERQSQNQHAVDLSREFANEATKVSELEEFLDVPIGVSDFLSELARTIPDRVVFSRINYRLTGSRGEVVLTGRVHGASGDATDLVSEYERFFTEDPYFTESVESVNVRSVARNPETDTLSFDFLLSIVPVGEG